MIITILKILPFMFQWVIVRLEPDPIEIKKGFLSFSVQLPREWTSNGHVSESYNGALREIYGPHGSVLSIYAAFDPVLSRSSLKSTYEEWRKKHPKLYTVVQSQRADGAFITMIFKGATAPSPSRIYSGFLWLGGHRILLAEYKSFGVDPDSVESAMFKRMLMSVRLDADKNAKTPADAKGVKSQS